MTIRNDLRSLGLLTGFGLVAGPFLVLSTGSAFEQSSVWVAAVALLCAISAAKLSSLTRSEVVRDLLVGVGVGFFFVFGMTAASLVFTFINKGGL